MTNWTTWVQTHTEERAVLTTGLDMQGSYCYMLSSDQQLSSLWQSHVVANTEVINATNFKIRALVRKNTTLGSLYFFARANATTKAGYILELKDNLSLYKGVIGDPFTGSYIESTGNYIFPKNVTHHLEISFHTDETLKTFIQVKVGDRGESEVWTTVFSIIVPNDTYLSGYWGFGCGTYIRRENFYFDNIQYFTEV